MIETTVRKNSPKYNLLFILTKSIIIDIKLLNIPILDVQIKIKNNGYSNIKRKCNKYIR